MRFHAGDHVLLALKALRVHADDVYASRACGCPARRHDAVCQALVLHERLQDVLQRAEEDLVNLLSTRPYEPGRMKA